MRVEMVDPLARNPAEDKTRFEEVDQMVDGAALTPAREPPGRRQRG